MARTPALANADEMSALAGLQSPCARSSYFSLASRPRPNHLADSAVYSASFRARGLGPSGATESAEDVRRGAVLPPRLKSCVALEQLPRTASSSSTAASNDCSRASVSLPDRHRA